MKIGQNWLNSLAVYAIVLGVWGAFPKPPDVLLRLTNFELFRWFLIFALMYHANQDVQHAVVFTIMLYLITKLFELRALVEAPLPPQPPHIDMKKEQQENKERPEEKEMDKGMDKGMEKEREKFVGYW